MTPHGTYNGYTNHRCRCRPCKDANAAFERERKARNKLPICAETVQRNAEARRRRIALWQDVRARGEAGAICDAIVRSEPVPDRLMLAVFT